MIRFLVFGTVELTDGDGREILSVIAQPKRLALLAYLAFAEPPGYRRRDELLALFWPDSDADRARSALRGALHYLRRSLGEEVLTARGDEVAVDPEQLRTDVAAFREAVAKEMWLEAVDLYRGDFLEAFHVDGAQGFERWLETTREELRVDASRAALEGARLLGERGDRDGSVDLARRAAALAPYDELVQRQAASVFLELGDQLGAFRLLEAFRDRVQDDLGVEPGVDTSELMAKLRGRRHGYPDAAPMRAATVGAGLSAPTPDSDRTEGIRPRTGARPRSGVAAAAVVAAGVVGAAVWWPLSPAPAEPAGARRPNPVAEPYYQQGLKYAATWRDASNEERRRLAPRAVAFFERSIDQDPELAEAHIALGVQHLWSGWWGWTEMADDRAWDALRRAMELRPDHPDLPLALGHYAYMARRNFPGAADHFERALELHPHDPEILLFLGLARRRQGQLDEALTHIRRARSIDPHSYSIHFIECDMLWGLRRHGDAEACYHALIHGAPDQPNGYQWLAVLEYAQSDLAGAREVLAAGRSRFGPDFARGAWVELLIADGDYMAALTELEIIRATAPDSGMSVGSGWDPYFVRPALRSAWLFGRLGQAPKADSLYRYVLSRVSNAPVAPPELGGRHLYLALAYAGLGRREEGLREAGVAERRMRSSTDKWVWPALLLDLAKIHLLLGEHRTALDLLTEALTRQYDQALPAGWLRVDPFWDSLRGDPRFKRLLYLPAP